MALLLADKRHLDHEAVANLEVLQSLEIRQLAWILRRGSQRIQSGYVGSLVDKQIVRRTDPHAYEVWMVADSVSELREELLERFKMFRDERDLPVR